MSFRQSNRLDAYTVAGTFVWNKYLGAKFVHVILIGGGQGGKGGIIAATAITSVQGQAGGGGGAVNFWTFPASILGNTESVIVGAGSAGTAGAAVPVLAAVGGLSKFGAWLFAVGGQGLFFSTGFAFSSASQTLIATGGGKGTNGNPGGIGYFGAAGGGAGGGITAGTGVLIAPFAGGSVGDNAVTNNPGYAGLLAGGLAAAAGPASNGGDGNTLGANSSIGGSGGGGGASWVTAGNNAGNGGKGGGPGGGGGAGGAGLSGVNLAGNGGNGADGAVYVFTSF